MGRAQVTEEMEFVLSLFGENDLLGGQLTSDK